MTLHLSFRFANAHWLYIAIPLFIIIILVRRYYTRPTLYTYPLVGYISDKQHQFSNLPIYFLYGLRLCSLAIMVFLMSKPQLIDQKSKITIEGIDIMMVLDMSGSMTWFDDIYDRRSRIVIAKEEAVKFVDKRQNDAIGLVVFGNYALTSCPLTTDKHILKNMIGSLKILDDDPMRNGTVISQALIVACRRLQKSQSKSKIIILLTDGEPSENDLPIQDAIDIAKLFGIKIYTIGIGSHGVCMQQCAYGVMQRESHFNTTLLQKVAVETEGKFFDAKKAQEITQVYDEIDRLEKSKYQDNVYMKYYDMFIPFVYALLGSIFLELILATFFWTIL